MQMLEMPCMFFRANDENLRLKEKIKSLRHSLNEVEECLQKQEEQAARVRNDPPSPIEPIGCFIISPPAKGTIKTHGIDSQFLHAQERRKTVEKMKAKK